MDQVVLIGCLLLFKVFFLWGILYYNSFITCIGSSFLLAFCYPHVIRFSVSLRGSVPLIYYTFDNPSVAILWHGFLIVYFAYARFLHPCLFVHLHIKLTFLLKKKVRYFHDRGTINIQHDTFHIGTLFSLLKH